MNGHDGWLTRRERSGDWMVEQAIHIWDVWNWVVGGVPARAHGYGRRDVFQSLQPDRNVTDLYHVILEWDEPYRLGGPFTQSWVDPADDAFTGNSLQVIGTEGGMDLATGVVTYRDRRRRRSVLGRGESNDTKLALEAFVAAAAVPAGRPRPVPPISLEAARDALRTALLVRTAVDAGAQRFVAMSEIDGAAVLA
jgi:predicted dehydrogenase